jgi:hypothetical protein
VNPIAEPKIDYSLMADTLKQFDQLRVTFIGKHVYDSSITFYRPDDWLFWMSDTGRWTDSLGMFSYSGSDSWGSESWFSSYGDVWARLSVDPSTRRIIQLQDSSFVHTWNNIPMVTDSYMAIRAINIPLTSIDLDSAVFSSDGSVVAQHIQSVTHDFNGFYRSWDKSVTAKYLYTDWNATPHPQLRIVFSRR